MGLRCGFSSLGAKETPTSHTFLFPCKQNVSTQKERPGREEEDHKFPACKASYVQGNYVGKDSHAQFDLLFQIFRH